MEQETSFPGSPLTPESNAPVDAAVLDDAARALKLSAGDRMFAELLAQGWNRTAAWRKVWPGKVMHNEGQRRSRASKLARSKKITKFIALLRGTDPTVAEIGDQKEAMRILWAQARSSDPLVAQRAIAQIDKLESNEASRRKAEIAARGDRAPRELLDDLCRSMGTNGVIVALQIARHFGVPYKPPADIPLPSPAEYEKLLMPVIWATELATLGHVETREPHPPAANGATAPETPGEAARAKYIHSVQSNPSPAGRSLPGDQAAPSPPAPAGDGAAVSNSNGFYSDKHLAALAFKGTKI